MGDWPSKFPEPFSVLAEDKGWIGQTLRNFAKRIMFPYCGDELLRDASRRDDAKEDPLEFLLGVAGIMREESQIIKAAQSQAKGLETLA